MNLVATPQSNEPAEMPAACPSRHVLPSSEWSLVDWYLEEQGRLTAVEQFARVQPHLSMPVYRTLLPAKPPGPGEQYAFEVDLDRCSGCKACVTACHSLNGLDDSETWRDVGLLTGGRDQKPFQQHVTTACHHCLEPACLDVCPTRAYEKDAQTGIVKHLDDQCFGCQYCILACPYNVPRYNARLGIVRKCDLCSQRLAVGEAPACVQACPHEAIRIQVVNVEQVKADAETSQFLPGTPDPQYTLPTTNYKTERPLPRNLMPADYFRVQTEHAHGPLVAMLVLTQLSVGGFLTIAVLGLMFPSAVSEPWRLVQFSLSLIMGYLALTASLAHLGRPWLAYRAILGLKTSWLSREILAFGLFAASATWLMLQAWLPDFSSLQFFTSQVMEWLTVGTGLAGVFCSAMIYHRTKRPFWNLYQSGTRFLLTTLLLGLAVSWVSLSTGSALSPLSPGGRGAGGEGDVTALHVKTDELKSPARNAQSFTPASVNSPSSVLRPPSPTRGEGRNGDVDHEQILLRPLLVWGVMATALLKALLELGALVPLLDRPQTPLKRSALLLIGPLRRSLLWRSLLLFICGVLIAGFSLANPAADNRWQLSIALVCLGGLTWGELLERSLFFKASVAFRMPGGPST